eukprot:768136-Hanusia_phi.AAC.4
MACVFIQSFSHEAAFQTIQRFLTTLIEIDELIGRWRQSHRQTLQFGPQNDRKQRWDRRCVALFFFPSFPSTPHSLAHLPCAGSSGHAYLNAVMQKSRIFVGEEEEEDGWMC